MLAATEPMPSSFYPNHSDGVVTIEANKESDCVAPTTDASNYRIWRASVSFNILGSRFFTNDAVKLANHVWIGMWSSRGSYDVMGGFNIGNPVSHGFVKGILQGFCSAGHGVNFCSEQLHSKDVEFLADDVFFAHVDLALKSKQGTGGCRGNAMLSGSGFGDNPLLAHSNCQEGLANCIVDFVGASMVEIFSLDGYMESSVFTQVSCLRTIS